MDDSDGLWRPLDTDQHFLLSRFIWTECRPGPDGHNVVADGRLISGPLSLRFLWRGFVTLKEQLLVELLLMTADFKKEKTFCSFLKKQTSSAEPAEKHS